MVPLFPLSSTVQRGSSGDQNRVFIPVKTLVGLTVARRVALLQCRRTEVCVANSQHFWAEQPSLCPVHFVTASLVFPEDLGAASTTGSASLRGMEKVRLLEALVNVAVPVAFSARWLQLINILLSDFSPFSRHIVMPGTLVGHLFGA